MNYHLNCSFAILCSFLATGCSTNTSRQTEKISASATVYNEHIDSLLETTKAHVISMDSKNLVSSRSTKSREENEKKLRENNDALEEWIAKTDQLREQNKLLLRYFQTLQKMMGDPTETDLSGSLGDISLSISRVNQRKSERRGNYSQNRALNIYEVGHIDSLSKMVISSRYAGKVRQALIRDRDIINRQIALQEQQLKEISASYERRAKFEVEDHYTNKVLDSYVNVSTPHFEPVTWTQDRLKWLGRNKTLKLFDDIKKANKAFRKDWSDILQGKSGVGTVEAILGDINRAVDSAYTLRDSRLYPQPVYTNIGVIPPK